MRVHVHVDQLSLEYSGHIEYPPRGACGDAPPADPPRARREDPLTSRLAAARVDEFAQAHNDKIRAALKRGDGTIYELAARIAGLDHVQVARRLPHLEGARRTTETRPGPKGRPCGVWTIE